MHRGASRRCRGHDAAQGRRRPLERPRARGIRGARRTGGARRALPGRVRKPRLCHRARGATSPRRVEVLEENDGIDSVAVASEDSPTGQASVESSRTASRCFTAVGPPGTPAPEPTVADGDVLVIGTLTDAADSMAAEDTVRELRADARRRARRGHGHRRRRDGDRHRLERHVDPRPHRHHPGDPGGDPR